ncbi:MAG: TRAP transporter substrate-binding protein DctP [Spirochaetes bacterium]|nr:TRAP transporter substrate-binding protein DctP [Spirochaetota bacterium]
MKSCNRILIFIFFILFFYSQLVNGQTIKMGSLVPTGSPWDISLKKIAAEWSKISGGKVKLKIYPGGIAGDEGDMIRKMRIGQLDAAAMTGLGLNRIYKGVVAIQLPLLIQNDRELEYVLNKMKPFYDKKIEEKGFKVLLWNRAGWAYFFSKKAIHTLDDMKKQKIFVWEGDADLVQTWKELGFKPVPLAATEIMTSLQSGMIDTLATSPIAAASYQWFGIAKYMSKLNWAPFLGGVIISSKAWNRIKKEYRDDFINVVEKIGAQMEKNALEADKKAIAVMKKHGLNILPVSDQVQKDWEITVNEGLKRLIGKSIPEDAYEKVKKYLEEYRKK